jgi:hypothetical protein
MMPKRKAWTMKPETVARREREHAERRARSHASLVERLRAKVAETSGGPMAEWWAEQLAVAEGGEPAPLNREVRRACGSA